MPSDQKGLEVEMTVKEFENLTDTDKNKYRKQIEQELCLCFEYDEILNICEKCKSTQTK